MVINTVDSFLEYHSSIKKRTDKLLEVIPSEYFEWAYKDGKFTIADVIRHVAAIERFMYAENVLGNASQYTGCGKELADGYDEVMRFYYLKRKEAVEIFRTLSDKDLQQKCTTPAGIDITIWKWLRAMIEHEVHHRAQLYIYLNMLEVNTPPIFGLTEEELRSRSEKSKS